MIVSTIRQYGLKLKADPEKIPFQHSANVQMRFIRAPDYTDYKVIGFCKAPGDPEPSKLKINDDGIFNLGPHIFRRRGTLSISFALYKDETVIHLDTIKYDIREAIGNVDSLLPAEETVWIELVRKEVDEYLEGLEIGGGADIKAITEEELDEIWNKN